MESFSDPPDTPELEDAADDTSGPPADPAPDAPAPEPASVLVATPVPTAGPAPAADLRGVAIARSGRVAEKTHPPAAAQGGVEAEEAVVQAEPADAPQQGFVIHPPQEPSVRPVMLSVASPQRAPLDAATPMNGSERVYATAFLPASVPETAELKMPSSTNEVREFIRRAALARGIDPDVAVRVALSEGGLTAATWTGDHASSFGPYQLHYGGIAGGANAVSGLGDAFTAETGLRANDPRTWRQQVEWTLDRAARSGWTPWHGAAAAGISPFAGLSGSREIALQSSRVHRHVDVPDQFAAQLSASEAYAACGPVAAVAVARWLGRNPTVVEALETAKRTGWTASGGMNGISNEKRLLDAMRISARLDTAVDWRDVQRNASSGNPVIVSTPQHYWVIDDFDPASGQYHVGRSGQAYRGGGEWMSAAQIQQFGGPPNGALFVDNPLVARPSVAATPAVADLTFDRWWEA